jgi:hypothetical protein
MRQLNRTPEAARRATERAPKIARGKLAEDYDGIGQHVMVSLAGASVGSALRARIAAGDFGTGQVIPAGTPVSMYIDRGQIEIVSLGVK